jgi:hypothetical protein
LIAGLGVVGWELIAGAAMADGDPTNEVTELLQNDKVSQAASAVENWLGGRLVSIRNEAGDFVLRNLDNTRRFRFDNFDTGAHPSPHMHLDMWLDEVGEWITTRIYPIQ